MHAVLETIASHELFLVRQEEMQRYLCSTGADETLHGEKLHITTHIRP